MSLASVAVVAIAGYLFFRLLPVFRAPQIVLSSPVLDINVADPMFALKGRVLGAVRLTADGEEVYVDGDGNFEAPMYLASGVNIINVAAEGRFGRKATITRYVVLDRPVNGDQIPSLETSN